MPRLRLPRAQMRLFSSRGKRAWARNSLPGPSTARATGRPDRSCRSNAGALPETMLESELFGHARGAYTGAVGEREGKLVSASGGTLLLDEIETISARAQVQLLRVLDDGVVQPLGSDRPRRVDIRLVCASNAELSEEVRRGTIREDFSHRIMVLNIRVPPLRERADDIPLLVSHFLRQVADRSGVPVPTIPEETLTEMLGHHWPGQCARAEKRR